MIPYDDKMVPCQSQTGVHVGASCPVCGKPVIEMVHEPYTRSAVQDHRDDNNATDGSCYCRCDRCKAPLRMNRFGFVFLFPSEKYHPQDEVR